MKKAVLYARVSSDRQEKEGFSIPAQIKLLHEYAKKNNISIVKEFVESETAKKAGRKQFNEMIHFLKKNSTCRIILVEKTDRLYRNLKDYVTLDEFDGLEIHFAKEGTTLSSSSRSQDKFMHGIRVLMAKNYIDNLSEEIRKGLKEKCEQGFCPTRAPIGYKNVKHASGRRTIELDETDAPFVKMIFEQYLIGNYTYKSLADYITNAGFRPRNKICTYKTIENILHQEFYTGNFIFKGQKYYNGQHARIITPEMFLQVQEKLRKKNGQRPRVHDFAYLGFIKCKHCGRFLTAEIQRGSHNSGEYIYYKCNSCKKMYIREDRFETAFKENILDNLKFTDNEIKSVLDITKELFQSETIFSELSTDKIHSRIKLLKNRISQLYTDKLDGMIDDDLYLTKKEEWQHELDVLLVKYEKINQASENFLVNLENLSNLCKDASSLFLKSNSKERRKLMNLILSNPIFDGSTLEFPCVPAFEYALNIKKVVSMGTLSNPTTKEIIIEMFKNYNNLNFTAIDIFRKCA